jgi:porin
MSLLTKLKSLFFLATALTLLFFNIVSAQESESQEAVAEEEAPDTLFGNWGGIKDSLQESGITSEVSMISDLLGLVSGGTNKGTNYVGTYWFSASIDTEAAGLWENGTFLFSAFGLHGDPLYQRVGDYQYSSNIDGYGVDTFSLYEAWYEHSFMDGKLSVLAGIHEYYSDFYYLDYSAVLINSSFAFGPELSQIGNSTYPITALAARIRVELAENSYAMFAVYDGIPGNPNNLKGTHIDLKKSDGLFYAAEIGITSSEENTPTDYYKIALGGWYRTTNFSDYAEIERSNNGGGYLIGERKIYNEEDSSQGLGVFAQIGATQGDRNIMGQYYGAGLHYTGLIEGRDQDITSFGVAHVRSSSDYKNFDENARASETAIELSYRAAIGHGLTLQPDIQYIVNPGANKDVDHALVVGTRIQIDF